MPADVAGLIERRGEDLSGLRGPFKVEEWAPEIPEIWAPKWTLARQKQVNHWVANDDPEGFAEIVLRFSVDQDGQRLFKGTGHGHWLKNVEPAEVVGRVARFILGIDDPVEDIGAIEGNSEGTPSDSPSTQLRSA